MKSADCGYRGPMKNSSEDAASTESATVTSVLAGYADLGFTSQFSAIEGARLECHTCGQQMPAADVRMSSLRRLEGASDPADMVAIVALSCANCGAKGTAVLGYGPAAEPEHSDVLHVLRDHRGDDLAPGNSSPGEVVGDDAVGAAERRAGGVS